MPTSLLPRRLHIDAELKWTGPEVLRAEHWIAAYLREHMPKVLLTEDFDVMYKRRLSDAQIESVETGRAFPDRVDGWDDQVINIKYDIVFSE